MTSTYPDFAHLPLTVDSVVWGRCGCGAESVLFPGGTCALCTTNALRGRALMTNRERDWAAHENVLNFLMTLDPETVRDRFCVRCFAPHVWKGRTEEQRLCGSCWWGE